MAQARALTVVAAGGAVGASIRYALALQFPGIWTILVINVLGSLLLGILAALLGPDRLWRLFLGVGVLGGFTTFSTFAVDVVQHPGSAVVYILATLLPALAAARIGMALGDEWHSQRRAQA
ncbi:CrcB family protein [Rhodococcus hoagii]|jgi:CrcB protein|uniref:Fluoride-specific ion channel FluC n=2 Tax=Rhodococcus hoagii TaxID=43767 RepID=A0AAE5CEH7_RHOHA|nr:CrcB family protein [Prescottella equi]GBF13001.1 camphor resistance protein CrcB [Rhodococcus sp. Br-6]MBM4475214.1 CrcB family protein [Prescottella equi]MBM4632621.1 CrcB family protein [Prescottella equi]MDP8013801.1 CrcB family protein [Prescottella equi]NKR87411.1 CrcB family protein [Prescottella equi]